MKNALILLLLMALASSLDAQIQKGSVLLGGTVGVNNISEEGSNGTIINVSPQVGFFLSKRFALGTGLDFKFQTGDVVDEVTSLALLPFARVYFSDSGMSRFFAQLDIGVEIRDFDELEGAPPLAAGLGIGADFFLNDNVAIETLLGYRRVQDFEADFGANVIGLNFGVVAFIGGSSGQ
ncbi:MAG: hypothetical protein OHK0019_28220 [Saprospiraceae bacterium]